VLKQSLKCGLEVEDDNLPSFIVVAIQYQRQEILVEVVVSSAGQESTT
jgi:hypothetical protein